MVRHSGYKENLKQGDGVLADKGFDVAEEIGLMGATLTTPAFKTSDQLTQKETEVSELLLALPKMQLAMEGFINAFPGISKIRLVNFNINQSSGVRIFFISG